MTIEEQSSIHLSGINSGIPIWAIEFSDTMSYVPFSHTGDRYRYELTRTEAALLRELLRERRHRLYLEDDIFHNYDDDVLEEIVRRRRRPTERGAQTARHLFTDRPLVRPMRPLSNVSSSILDSWRGTKSNAPSQVGGSSFSSLHPVEMERILRENEGFFPDQYHTTRSTNSSSPSAPERLNANLSALRCPAIVPNQEPSPEAKMRKKLLDLLWSQPVGLIHDHLSKSRIKSSGEWIFALPAFKSWRKATTESPKGVERGENCLWLQGSLGAGKTMLM